MFHWIPYAFVRIVLFFIEGILLGIYLPDYIPLDIAILAFLVLIVAYVVLFMVRLRKGDQIFNPGFIGLCAIFLAGYIHLLEQTDNRSEQHLSHLTEAATYYQVKVSRYPQEKARTWKVEADVSAIFINDTWNAVEGKVLLYFPIEFYH